MALKHIEERREAVREAIEGGSFGDAELDQLCREFDCSAQTIKRDARIIRENARRAMRDAKRAELHVLPGADQAPPAAPTPTVEGMPDEIDWRNASREDGYVWMLERLAGMAVDPRAIAPAKVGAIKTLSSIFDQLHAHRAEQADGADSGPVDPEVLLREFKAATKGMPRKMRREMLAALG
jgi:hypothetical protein